MWAVREVSAVKNGARQGARTVLFEERCQSYRNGGEERRFGGGVDGTRMRAGRAGKIEANG
jgi:hypothetical protein